MSNPQFNRNFSEEDTSPIRRKPDRSLDVTQPMETFDNSDVFSNQEKNANYQPIQISNSRLPLRQEPVVEPRKKKRGCGCLVWGLIIPILAILVGFLLFPYRTNVLILGVDRSPEGTFVGRTDTIMMLSVVPLKPDVNLLSIPRDLWVNIPNFGENRINTAHFFAEANQPGELLLVNKLAYRLGEPHTGDVIVFHYPGNPAEDYIKRLIGLPGDEIKVEGGLVYVNGQPLEEPYISAPPSYRGVWEIPEDSFFVLGDNRNQSSDSHSWGFVPKENIVGKALIVYWPIDQIKTLTYQHIVNAAR